MELFENLKGYEIVLMSQSPRRRELLKELGLSFMPARSDAEENYPESLEGKEIPMYLSQIKAQAFKLQMKSNSLVIAADTIVYCDKQVLGKPATSDEAIAMLENLSGRKHEVITGITILTQQEQKTFSASSIVEFAKLTDVEIRYYVQRYQPLDKAGAYGIQEWIGMIGVKCIEGSYYNVMGLPVHRLYQELKSIKPYREGANI